jgi:hypothetical protein
MNRVLTGMMVLAVAAGCVGVRAQTAAAAKPAWETDLERRHLELVEKNGSGTDAELRDELLKMQATDQAARGLARRQATDGAKDAGKLQMAVNMADIDAQLTTELKGIVAKDGWPTIAMVGMPASNAAMLVLTHTKDHAWQESLLPKLETLADTGKIDGSALALVIDKELVNEGKLQRYGTQFKQVGDGIAMFGVEDPSGLDARRAQVFLPPMEVYKQQMAAMYHLKVTNMVVMAVKQGAGSRE